MLACASVASARTLCFARCRTFHLYDSLWFVLGSATAEADAAKRRAVARRPRAKEICVASGAKEWKATHCKLITAFAPRFQTKIQNLIKRFLWKPLRMIDEGILALYTFLYCRAVKAFLTGPLKISMSFSSARSQMLFRMLNVKTITAAFFRSFVNISLFNSLLSIYC